MASNNKCNDNGGGRTIDERLDEKLRILKVIFSNRNIRKTDKILGRNKEDWSRKQGLWEGKQKPWVWKMWGQECYWSCQENNFQIVIK